MDASIRQYRLPPDAIDNVERHLRKSALIPQMSILAAVVLLSTLLVARGAPNLKAMIPFAACVLCFSRTWPS